MKKKSYYLQMYYSWIVLGRMPDDGLCNSVNTELLKLFEPSDIESRRLERKGYCSTFWASGVPIGSDPKNELSGFTPLRQTIVLFLAAMNDEL